MLLFRKLVDETQMSTTLEATSYHSLKKISILLPLRAIQNHSFHYETPCSSIVQKLMALNKIQQITCNFIMRLPSWR